MGLPLTATFNPDTNVAGIGQIYQVQHKYHDEYISVHGKLLKISNNAPIAENIAVLLILKNNKNEHKIKQYPLPQAASLIVSIVKPTGLNLLKTRFFTENMVQSQQIYIDEEDEEEKPFWYQTKQKQFKQKQQKEIQFSKTENILCEKQNISLKIASLDELGRELHAMEQYKVVSNDTTIISPRKEIKISTENIGGAMYATVHLDALQAGYATITFREKDILSQQQQQQQSSSLYVYDNPTFLRTFLTVHVLSTSECDQYFGVFYQSDSKQTQTINNQTKTKKQIELATKKKKKTAESMELDYKNGRNWKAKTVKTMPMKSSKSMMAVFGLVVLLMIIVCSWGNCQNIIFGQTTQQSNTGTLGQYSMNTSNSSLPPAAFNPYAPVQDDIINQSNSWQM